MANIRKVEGKNGATYKITVCIGRDGSGKQRRHYLTWRPPAGMSAREVTRELQRITAEFEQDILDGFQVDNKQTFAEYAAYCYDLHEARGDKPQTLARVRRQTRRINEYIGNMLLQDIKPQHLNAMYTDLSRAGSYRHIYAYPRKEFFEMATGKECAAFSRECGTTPSTMRRLLDGNRVTKETAKTVESHLKKKNLFEIIGEGKALSPGTIRDYHMIVHSVFKQAYKDMVIKFNPAERVTLPKMRRVREQKALQPEQLQEVLEALKSEPITFRTLITFLIVTGCRRGEALAMTWDKVDFKTGEVRIDRSLMYLPETGIQAGTTKTDEARTIALPKDTVKMMRSLWAWQAEEKLKYGDLWAPGDYVFTRWDGKPIYPCSVNTELTAFCKRHDLPHMNPHLFRHSAASVLLNSGVDVLSVSAMLGHANAGTTLKTYAHALEKSRKKTADCIEREILNKKQA